MRPPALPRSAAPEACECQAGRAGELIRRDRRSHSGIGPGDRLIAATCDIRGARRATLNVRHFPMIADLKPPFALR